MNHRLQSVFLAGALLLSPVLLHASSPEQLKADEQSLRDAGLRTDGAALLDFLKARTPGDRTLEDIEHLVRKLGSESFRVRRRATEDLIRIGAQGLRPLRAAAESKDPEVARRARECLSSIERTGKSDLIAAAVRLLGERRPLGTAQAILDYLPFVEDGYLADELLAALVRSGIQQGKADEALRKALDGKNAIRRGAAAEALVRGGSDEDRKVMRKLLKDDDVGVRTRVALALIERKDREAVAVLIEALPDASRDQFWRIEQIISALGGDDAPKLNGGATPLEMREYRTACKKWWNEKGTTINLAMLDDAQRIQGLTLVVSLDPRVPGGGRLVFMGRVSEVGRDGKLRWEIANLNYPIEAQVLGRDRVLITEYRGRLVSERNFKGEVLWQKQTDGLPISAHRADNGNTLIATRTEVIEVNKAGQEVFRFTSQQPAGVIGARRLKNGETIVLERTGACHRLNAKGETIKQVTLGAAPLSIIGTQFDVLPNGNILVPVSNQNKVLEFSPTGQQVWEHTCERPTAVSRLPNGNTLIASRYSKLVIEVDRAGKKVWEFESPNGTVISARRR